MLFEGEERGSDILVAPFVLQSPQEGLYWFIISIDDHELTRVPLRVIYQPVPPQATPQQLR